MTVDKVGQTLAAGVHYDVIVVGSGIAGLYTSLLATTGSRVLLVTKGNLEESNTRYAQGGIAVALRPDDSPELHLRDTLAASDGLSDPVAASMLTHDAPVRIQDLLVRGVPFDREDGQLAWTLEAAHTIPRVLHAGGDATGRSIEATLAGAVRESSVDVVERAFCTSLLLTEGVVTGISLLDENGRHVEVSAGSVVLATGGAGQLYSRTTNPTVATGDGLAIAYRAGAELMDMEFMQFHPTAFAGEGAPAFLISEAIRGRGAVLRDLAGNAFMARHHLDAELAPRDVVARAIHQEMEQCGEDHVLLDATHLPAHLIETGFPGIVSFCRSHGIDPVFQPIPVAPAAHYLMGGIRADTWGRTSLPNLYACGEVACTGVHGANRLASNSLLEGLVFAARVAKALHEPAGAHEWPEKSEISRNLGRVKSHSSSAAATSTRDPDAGRRDLRGLMWRNAGLIRSGPGLDEARQHILRLGEADALDAGVSSHELKNLLLVASLLVEAASLREESRGAHFRSDFPDRKAAWSGHTVLSKSGPSFVPLPRPSKASLLPATNCA